jgi:hypothetical protein
MTLNTSKSLRWVLTAAFSCGVVALASSASAQQVRSADADEASSACTHTFTNGSGEKQISYCVNAHGNMMSFISPQGFEAIRLGALIEGYAICSSTGVHGYDFADAGESAWGASGAPIVGSSGVTIIRTTSDGVFRIEQKFTRDATEKDVTIAMTVVNLTAFAKNGVQVHRGADVDNTFSFSQDFTKTFDLVNASFAGRGSSLGTLDHSLAHSTHINASIIPAFNCAPAAGVASPSTGDYSASVVTTIGSIAGGAKKTVKFRYARQ